VVNPFLTASNGHAFYGNSFLSDNGATNVVAHSSDDSGITWSGGTDPASGQSAQNLALVVEPRDPDTVHAAWSEYTRLAPNLPPLQINVRAATSSDGGDTFSTPVTVYTPPPERYAVNTRLFNNSDGSLLAVFDTVPKEALVGLQTNPRGPVQFAAFASRSTDGGETWSDAVPAGAPVFFGFTDPEGGERTYLSAKFDAATGPSGRGVVAWAEPLEDGRGTIRMVTSGNGGTTWSAPATAISVPAHVIQPAVAVARDGRLGLFWYDTRRDEDGDGEFTADAWFAVSRDGQRWRERHLAGPFDLNAAYDPDVPFYDGDQGLGVYQDLTSVGRHGFGAAYTVGPPLAKNGATDVEFARINRRASGNAND
jgi:hypothetical protein